MNAPKRAVEPGSAITFAGNDLSAAYLTAFDSPTYHESAEKNEIPHMGAAPIASQHFVISSSALCPMRTFIGLPFFSFADGCLADGTRRCQ